MKKYRKIIIILLIIIAIVLSGFIAYDKYFEYKYININNKINNQINEDNIKIEIRNNNKELIDKYREEYNNDEIVGKISILNSDFSMLFAQSKDNDYYLTHLINKEYNKLGATFLDYRNNIDEDRKVNIYGHNNGKAGISFNYIMNYEDEEFYNNHKKILISTDKKDYTYEIFSIQIVDTDYIHMQLEFSESEWKNYLNKVLKTSLYKEDINIDEVTKVLTLQTCTNRVDWEFLLVNARLVE